MKIGFDLDDVLLDFNGPLCRFHNERFGSSYQRADIHSYNLHEVWNCKPEEATARVAEFYLHPYHLESLPVTGAPAALKELAKRISDLFVVTSKPERLRPVTEKWLAQHYSGIFKSVHFTNHFHGEAHERRSKADVCRELGVEAFIEDSHKIAAELSLAGLSRVFLLDAPWNQATLLPGITRFHAWSELLELI